MKSIIISLIHTDLAPQCIWDIFYSDKAEKNYTNEKNKIITKNPEEKSIFFFDCSFFDLQDGCIYIKDKTELKFLHSFCRFSNNTRNGYGGCIYFDGNSQIVQHRLCAYDIEPKYHSGFCYTLLPYNTNNYNYFLENSLTKCKNSEYGIPIYLRHGLIQFSSTNSSGNDAYTSPGYTLDSPTSNSSFPSIVNYSTFEGNKANSRIIYHINNGDYIITKSNILNNTNQNWGHLYSEVQSTKVIECSFFGNKGSVLFYIGAIDTEFIVRNCYIDNFTRTGEDGRTASNESIDTKYMLHILSHYSTHGCIAALPQPINFNFYGISYFLTASENIPQTHSCKYKKFFRGSVKAKF